MKYSNFEINNEILSDLWMDETPEELIWIEDDKEYSIKDMDTNHIDECITLLERRQILNQLYLASFFSEIERRERGIGIYYTNE